MSMDVHRIGILMPDTIEGHEIADYIETELIQRGYEAEIRYAEIADWQPDQARDLIDCECKILILWALQTQAWEWLEEYEEIQVIALMTLVRISGVIKYYLGFNYREVGRQQGEYIEEALDLSSGANCNIELFSSPDSRKINEILMGALEILQPYLDDGGLTGEIHDITLLDSWTKENAYIYIWSI